MSDHDHTKISCIVIKGKRVQRDIDFHSAIPYYGPDGHIVAHMSCPVLEANEILIQTSNNEQPVILQIEE